MKLLQEDSRTIGADIKAVHVLGIPLVRKRRNETRP